MPCALHREIVGVGVGRAQEASGVASSLQQAA
jgi:hypothetical protein